MAVLVQLFILLPALLPLCYSEGKGGPRDSICRSKGFVPFKGHDPRKIFAQEHHKVTITLIREKDNEIVDCVEDDERYTGITSSGMPRLYYHGVH